MSLYKKCKDVFANSNRYGTFISLDQNIYAQNRLFEAIKNQPFSILLLYGVPGVGKSFLLENTYNKLKDECRIYHQKVPFDNFKNFLIQLNQNFHGYRPDVRTSAQELINEFVDKIGEEKISILIDEAQMYKDDNLEYLRVLSDSNKIKLVLAMHKIAKEDAVAKEYFSSRIWEIIELRNLSRDEVMLFVEKKLRAHSLDEAFSKVSPKVVNRIFSISGGNLRKISKLLYKIFEIASYYDDNKPTMLKNGSITTKIVEMAAIDTGLIDA